MQYVMVSYNTYMENNLPPITSLISKSEKAILKLKPESWQHIMLTNNLSALQYASKLMSKDESPQKPATKAEISEYLKAFDSMIAKTAAAQLKFSPGTAQHSLLTNRLNSLRAASSILEIK
jgi:hypothetical protein